MTPRRHHGFGRLAGFVALTAVVAACGPREPASESERLSRGRELVQQMSTRLAAATSARATTTEIREVVSRSGTRQQVTLAGEYAVRRPDRFHAKVSGGRQIEMWYDGKRLTVAEHEQKVFAQAPMPETVDRTLDALAERFDMALPMGDLFYSSAEKALLSDKTTGGYAGIEAVGGTACYRLAFKDLGVEWELWLPVKGEPLPRRLKVVRPADKRRPMIDVTFTAWDLNNPVADTTFTANLPSEYEGIAMLQTAASVRNRPDGSASQPPASPATKK
jgi:hypothetical protein